MISSITLFKITISFFYFFYARWHRVRACARAHTRATWAREWSISWLTWCATERTRPLPWRHSEARDLFVSLLTGVLVTFGVLVHWKERRWKASDVCSLKRCPAAATSVSVQVLLWPTMRCCKYECMETCRLWWSSFWKSSGNVWAFGGGGVRLTQSFHICAPSWQKFDFFLNTRASMVKSLKVNCHNTLDYSFLCHEKCQSRHSSLADTDSSATAPGKSIWLLPLLVTHTFCYCDKSLHLLNFYHLMRNYFDFAPSLG